MMEAKQKIEALRSLMKEEKIDLYVIPTDDYHNSEYVADYFRCREFMTGFTGSAGTCVVTLDDAVQWVDGRYYIQGEQELAGSGIRMFKSGVEGFDTITTYIEKKLPENGKIAFDGRVIPYELGVTFENIALDKNASLKVDVDLVDKIWADRPQLTYTQLFNLGAEYTGESADRKLAELRKEMKKLGATHHVIATLDDVAWLTNLRGHEVSDTAMYVAYVLVTETEAFIYADNRKFNEVRGSIQNYGFVIKPYNDIYGDISKISAGKILIDPERANYSLFNSAAKGVKIIKKPNPTVLQKARKNTVELENIRKAHIRDGVAQTRFMHWVKTNVGKEEITEIGVGEKLLELRSQQHGFLWPSFGSICAYRENAAQLHYSAKPSSNKTLEAKHLLLTDSGGNYMEGSTDTTRTYALGTLSHIEKVHFTAVVRGMVNLSRARFLKGTRGVNLDVIARQPLWDVLVDYKSGTGHGVGYLTTIHEGPCRIALQMNPFAYPAPPLEEGMVLTNEPGAYVAGSHGIRIENELVVKAETSNEHGTFLNFETITFTPIDLDAIIPEMMEADEKTWLNEYHQQVFDKLSPHMLEEERVWLKAYTRAI